MMNVKAAARQKTPAIARAATSTGVDFFMNLTPVKNASCLVRFVD
jgi:hypothetical protein